MTTRRQILKSAVAPMIVPSVVLGQRAGAVAPSDKIVFGGIGIGARGAHDLSKLLNIRRPNLWPSAMSAMSGAKKSSPPWTRSMATTTARCTTINMPCWPGTDIDAVLIATGDRWHTPLAIIAAQHGKDVYCEKPCSMSMEESWALADAFRRYNRIYQAGCQRRNGANFGLVQGAAEVRRAGQAADACTPTSARP